MRVRVTPRQLIALASVASAGSLTRASDALHRTQAAVSTQLKQLSDALGMPVVRRERYGVRLTAAAEALLPYAHACVRALEGAQQTIESYRGLELGHLRIFASTSVAAYMLQPVLAEFHAKHPGIELRMNRGHAGEAIGRLASGEADIAIVRGATANMLARQHNYRVRTLVRDRTLLVVRPSHPLARRRKLAPKQLDGIELVMRESGSQTRAAVEKMAERANIRFKIKYETVGTEALKEAVFQGFGAGFLSRLSVRREIQAGTLAAVLVDAPELIQEIWLLYPALGQSSPAVQRFIDILGTTKPTEDASRRARRTDRR
jgi:DNA-binding transcriptional LysR family regulator